MPEAEAIICLANDRVYDFVAALAESVRRHSDLPLVIIPFDDRMSRIEALARRRGLDLLDDPVLTRLDGLGARIWPGRNSAPHAFRKLAAFWVGIETFLLVDADVILLSDPRRFLDAHRKTEPDAVWCFDTGEGQAYRPGPLRDQMVRRGFPGVNTGLLIAHTGLIAFEQVESAIDEAVPVREQFLELAEQPFLNFLLEREHIPVSKVGDLFADVAGTTWAGANLELRGDTWIVDEPAWPDHGRAPAAIHWSGGSPSLFMRHRHVFVEYSAPSDSALARAQINLRLAALATVRLPGRARSLLSNLLRGRALGAWR
jgi:hypothetical protein